MVDPLDGKLRLNDSMRREIVRIGAEREPVLVVDDFLADADVLVEFAATHARFGQVADTFYPGVRAPLPPIYSFAVRTFLGEAIRETFDLGDLNIVGEVGDFSIVTTPPERLHVLQRLPHFDSVNPMQLAVLHYLCRPADGGTAFYRHRSTGFETMSEGRMPAYKVALEREIAAAMPPARYIDGDTPSFERTAKFDAAFNRLLIYRSKTLHCAQIPADLPLTSDPRAGRLTANIFYFCG